MIAIRKLLSAVAAASLLATGSLAGAASLGGAQTLPTAAAQVDDPPAAVDGIPETGNLHVHKRIGLPDEALPNDGRLQDADSLPGDPAVGITYEAYRLQDLSAFDEYVTASNLTAQEALEQVEEEGATATDSATTLGPDGIAEFNGLQRGLYLVVEEPVPVAEGEVPVSPAAPFLVAVPLTDPVNLDDWLDTVHVYPKGQTFEAGTVVKGINDDDVPAHVGDQISYSISGTVPGEPAEALSGFSITDKFPAELGAPEGVTVTISGAEAEEGVEYVVDDWSVVEGDETPRNVLLVQLTDTGIAAARDGDGLVTVDFNATVNRTPQGTLDNLAWISPTNLGGAGSETGWNPNVNGPNPGIASNETRSIYGEITIIKTGQGEGAPLLPNAIFELHRCTAGETDTEGTLVEDSEPISVNGATVWETNAEGIATISGIHLANVQDQDNLAEPYTDLWAGNGTQFCLVETQAPEGYELLPAPVLVTMPPYDGNTIELVNADQPIQNVEANVGSQLPLTGGIGIWAILGIGLLLLLAAGAYYLANRKRDA